MKMGDWIKGFLAAMMALAATVGNAGQMIDGDGMVYRVIDGDTYIVNIESLDAYQALYDAAPPAGKKHFNPHFKSFKIRLANVDTAESVHVDASRNTEAGRQASAFVRQWIQGAFVGFRCWEFDKYGRAICSVSRNGKDVGVELVRKGLSKYVTRWGNHPFLHNQYQRAASPQGMERHVNRL